MFMVNKDYHFLNIIPVRFLH